MHLNKPLSGASILVVEDEPFIAFDLQETLTDGGAEVVLARSVTEALRLAQCKRIDAALLDVRLDDGIVTAVAEELATKAIPTETWIFPTSFESHPPPEVQCVVPSVLSSRN